MLYNYKTHEKEIYGIHKNIKIINLPKQNYICINGVGNPNNEDFKKNISSLYSMAYTIKMKFKSTPEYYDYVIFPLEGYWSLTEKGIKTQLETDILDKNEFKYILMIKQPKFVNEKLFNCAKELAIKNKNDKNIENIYFKEFEETQVAQLLHIGPYDDEPKSFFKLNAFIKENNKIRSSYNHKEIYLSDARRVDSSKLKTILQVEIKDID